MKQFKKAGMSCFTFILSLFPVLGHGADFFSAVNRGDVEEVRKLLEDGFPPNERDTDGEAALHLAAERCDPEMASALLEGGANPDIEYALVDVTPLHIAAREGCVKAIEVLVFAGANMEAKVENRAARLLLRLTASLNAEYSADHTPAYWAGLYGHDDAVEALKNSGAEPVRKGNEAAASIWYQLGESLLD